MLQQARTGYKRERSKTEKIEPLLEEKKSGGVYLWSDEIFGLADFYKLRSKFVCTFFLRWVLVLLQMAGFCIFLLLSTCEMVLLLSSFFLCMVKCVSTFGLDSSIA